MLYETGKDWVDMHGSLERFTTVASTWGRHCREWPVGARNAETLTLVEEYSRPGSVVVFTDGSVRRGVISGSSSQSTLGKVRLGIHCKPA